MMIIQRTLRYHVLLRHGRLITQRCHLRCLIRLKARAIVIVLLAMARKTVQIGSLMSRRVSFLREDHMCVCGLVVTDVYISEIFVFYCYPIIEIHLKVAPNRPNVFYLPYERNRRLVYKVVQI